MPYSRRFDTDRKKLDKEGEARFGGDWATEIGTNEGVIVDSGTVVPSETGVSSVNGLMAHWDFSEGSGSTVTDSVNGNVGTLGSGASFVSALGGSAIRTDGSSTGVVTIPYDESLIAPNMTVSLLAKLVSGDGSFLVKDGAYGYDIGIDKFSDFYGYLLGGDVGYYGESAQTGEWYHMVTTANQDTGRTRFYLDGIYRKDKGLRRETGDGGDLVIGGNVEADYKYVHAEVADLRLYNRVLSDSEVSALTSELMNS